MDKFPVFRKKTEDGDLDWMAQTPGPACGGELRKGGRAKDAEFFPTKEQDNAWQNARLQYCAGCPVMAQCLAFGKKNFYTGLWGGSILDGHGNEVRRPFGRKVRKNRRRDNGSLIMEEAS